MEGNWLEESNWDSMENLKLINQKIIETIDNGVLVLNNKGIIISCNSSLAMFFGRKQDEFIGKNYLGFLDSSGFTLEFACLGLLKETFEQGKEFKEHVIHVVLEADKKGYYQFSSRILRNSQNNISQVVVVLKDITKEVEWEDAAKQTERCAMVSQLAAGAAHEIKNPLTSVRGFIQLLQKDYLGTTREEYLKIMIGEIDRVTKIVQDFSALVKPNEPIFKVCYVEDIIREILMLVESEASLRQVTLELKIPPNLPPVFVDPNQIKQILLNLIKNSFDAMPLGGKLFLRITPSGYKINIIIMDQGMGMDDHTLNKVLSPFFTTKANGTGLGLSIAQQILSNHDGKMVIRSKPNQGTKILLQLPAYGQCQGSNSQAKRLESD